MPTSPERSWDLRFRSNEEYDTLRAYEIKNFGLTTHPPRRSAQLAAIVSSSQAPENVPTPMPLPGVYTLPALNPQPRRPKRKTDSDISLPQLPSRPVPGYFRQHVDTTIELSSDGTRAFLVAEGCDVCMPKRSRLSHGDVNHADDGAGMAGGAPGLDSSSDSEDSCLSDHSDEEEGWQYVEEGANPAAVLDETGELRESKRKTYASSDDPMSLFIPMASIILNEIFVRESLPPAPCCQTCRLPLVSPTSAPAPPSPCIPSDTEDSRSSTSPSNTPSHPSTSPCPTSAVPGGSTVDQLWKCTTCGEFLECRSCCLRRHRYTPLHSLQARSHSLKWNHAGYYSRTSLHDMGFCYQLGHGGDACPVPGALRSVTVMHVNGVHSVSTSVCGCNLSDDTNEWRQYIRMGWYPASTAQPRTFATFECLRHFRRLNVVANMNIRDYVTTLERLSDPTGIEIVPDRYKSFGLMSQQVSYMDRMCRSGLAYGVGGLGSAPWGSAAVRCWACPR